MIVRAVSPDHPEPEIIREAAAHLRAGRLVAFPTETVYGLGAHALDERAVAAIYAAKGRPAYNPLIVHLAEAGQVDRVASTWPPIAQQLAEAFWPGPLTLVLPKRPEVPDAVTAGLGTVAVRVPAHVVAQALLAEADIPVAAPSANRSTELSPTRAAHVARALGDRVAMILDGGPTSVGIESTVLDVSGSRAVLLRPGGIARPAIERVVGGVLTIGAEARGEEARPSPGMMDRHYAPRARVVLFRASDAAAVAQQLATLAERARASGEGGIGAVLWSGAADAVRAAAAVAVTMPGDAAPYARRLYDVLHELDEAGCSIVAVELPPDTSEWEGVRDRLLRASRRGDP